MEAKHAFEAYCRQHGCQVQHYHCDNGHFADNRWMVDAAQRGQTISFCRVSAHHQNGLAKKAIRDLQEQVRKSLLHAKARWPQAIHTSLWPYALCMACYVSNMIPISPGGTQSRLEKFTRVQVASSSKHTNFWLSSFCLAVCSHCRQIYSKMGRQSETGSISWTFLETCLISGIGVKPYHWSGFTAIPCNLQ